MEQTTFSPSAVDMVLNQVRSEIKRTQGWLRFLGVLSLIGGILTALMLVGILYIFIGIILLNAGSRGKDFVDRGDVSGLVAYHSKLKTLFTIYGVLAIIGLAGAALAILISLIVFLIFGAAAFSNLPWS